MVKTPPFLQVINMPKLLTCAVCRQVIVDRDDSSISLISLINSLNVNLQPGQNVAPDMALHLEWNVVTAWLRLDGDAGKSFEQRQELITPSGKIIEGGKTLLRFDSSPDSRILTILAKAGNFPVGAAGIVILRVDLREAGEQGWETCAEYPIEVIYKIQQGDPGIPT